MFLTNEIILRGNLRSSTDPAALGQSQATNLPEKRVD